MAALKSALGYALYNAMQSGGVVAAGGVTAFLLDLLDGTGPRLVAVFFALLGGLWRWHKYQLSPSAALSGLSLSGLLAFVYGDTQIPLLTPLIGAMRPESVPMLNGLVIGLLGLLVITMAQDVWRAYRQRGGGTKP